MLGSLGGSKLSLQLLLELLGRRLKVVCLGETRTRQRTVTFKG